MNFNTISKALSLIAIITALGTYALALDTLPATPPIPAGNPMTPAKISLGKQLYFDKRLSKNQTISCNSCHNVLSTGDGAESGTHPKSVSTGFDGQKGNRNSPTVWNSAFYSVLFWDGRAASLEEQAKGPIFNPVEMGMPDHESVLKRINAIPGYQKQFAEVFGGPSPVTIDHLAQAIASYERTLVTPNSPYDQFIQGKKTALSPSAQRGMNLVQTVGCTSCHSGAHFSGPSMPPGLGMYMKFPLIAGSEYEKKYHLADDLGRYQVTHNDADKNMWRVQSWRNIALTAPYFHNGSVKTLDEAVRVMAKTQLNKDLSSAEVADITAFLKSLTGERPAQTMPQLPK